MESAPHSRSDRRRNQPHDPRDDGEVLLYAYAKGTLSFRRIAAKLRMGSGWRRRRAERRTASGRGGRGCRTGGSGVCWGSGNSMFAGLEAVRKEWSLECMAPNTHRRTSYHQSYNHIDVFPRGALDDRNPIQPRPLLEMRVAG